MSLYMSIYYKVYRKLKGLIRVINDDKGLKILFILFVSEIIFGLSNPNWFTQLDMIILSLLLVYTRVKSKINVRA